MFQAVVRDRDADRMDYTMKWYEFVEVSVELVNCER